MSKPTSRPTKGLSCKAQLARPTFRLAHTQRLRPTQAVAAPAATTVDWAAVKKDIIGIIEDKDALGGIGDRGPTIVRLAWHSSGTYDKMSKTGGSGKGTIRFKEEMCHQANAGLNNPVEWLQAVKEKHPNLSYADLYTFAGAVAIEAMGGPQIPWRTGRVDDMEPDGVLQDGRLPEPDKGSPKHTAQGLRDTFYRMGFDDREIVVLSGAHALGRCHEEWSGYVGPWTPTPTKFTNLYYKLLLKTNWVPNEATPKFQFKDPSGKLMMLPSDVVLTQDPEFKKHVEMYAADKKKFFNDFADAFSRLMELGTQNLVPIA